MYGTDTAPSFPFLVSGITNRKTISSHWGQPQLYGLWSHCSRQTIPVFWACTTPKKAIFAIGDSFQSGHCYQKNLLLKYFQNFTVLSQRFNIAYYLQPDSVAPLESFPVSSPVFSLLYSFHRFLHFMFWILRSPIICVCALDLRLLFAPLEWSYQPF